MAMTSATNPIGNLIAAISDVYYTTHDGLFRPNYHELLIDLVKLDGNDIILPRNYQTNVLQPFIKFLKEQLKEEGFNKLFHEDEEKLDRRDKALKKAIEEMAEGLLQRNYEFKYFSASFRDLKAIQAIVTTIFDDILRSDITQLATDILPPLAKWGGRKGPYAIPQSMPCLKEMNIRAGIVSFPAEHRTGGLLAWISLGHEVAGHHFLRSIDGLIPKLRENIKTALMKSMDPDDSLTASLIDYWCACAEETACDVLGVLNIGPSFGIGLIGYFRGVRGGKLKSTGPMYSTGEGSSTNSLIFEGAGIDQIFVEKVSDNLTLKQTEGLFGYIGPYDPTAPRPLKYQKFKTSNKHPLDIIRPFVIAQIIRSFNPSSHWSELIEKEALSDLNGREHITLLQLIKESPRIAISPVIVPVKLAIKTARIAAEAVAESTILIRGSVEKRLREVVKWEREDEELVEEIKRIILSLRPESLPTVGEKECSARHILAASILSAVQTRSDSESVTSIHVIESIFNKMKGFLVEIFERKPTLNLGQHIVVSLPPIEEEE
ncbi:MAG: hypothetical protein K1060chlam3_00629 [Candidatus Anoxychlamydiales bacterium]|nr:hypothetical protein [Candidatus Anoxychlamydiales bacterium]